MHTWRNTQNSQTAQPPRLGFKKEIWKVRTYQSYWGRGAVKLPVERESCQLALQPHVDATVFLSRQRDLNLVFSLAADSRQAGLNHLTQVSEEGFDWGSQTPVKLLMMENKNVFIKHGFLLIWLLRTVRIKISAGYLFTFVHTCALLWMTAVSILSSHTQCMSVSRIWYAVSPNQLLARSWHPLMLTGSQGRRKRMSSAGAPLPSIGENRTKELLKGRVEMLYCHYYC